jgi:CTP-dependent riboflavin kinase
VIISGRIVNGRRKLEGIIFSDLGAAAGFMALDWVQQQLKQSLGFLPFPATLNLRPKSEEDAIVWLKVREELKGVVLFPPSAGSCTAQIFFVELARAAVIDGASVKGAVLLPEVANYPEDKIEVVAPVRLKDHFGVSDGDQLTVEFIN